VHTYDSHLHAAFCALRRLLIQDVDVFTYVDRSLWYDVIEELRERYEAVCLRRASGKTGERSNSVNERSNSVGERSNSVGERSNSVAERGKSSRSVARPAASPATS
jgi:hypothetical protein